MKTTIRNPGHLLLAAENQPVCGCNQDWFRSLWQRRAGCGPTTASNLLIYHQRAGHLTLPQPVLSTDQGLVLMESVWPHVKPTAMGVHTPGLFARGLQSFFSHYGIKAQTQALLVHRRSNRRPAFAEVVAFIRAGLALDGPVAFLNLSNGAIRQLDPWHWVTITALVEHSLTDVEVEICDNLNRFTMNLREWYETTSRGGGFVYLVL